jgi:hypothetical protein
VTTQVQSQTSADPTPPPPDADSAQYEALRKELELDVGEQEGAEPEPASAPAEPVTEPAELKPAPTELENLKTALREAREAAKAEQARTDTILAALREAKERRQPQEPEKKAEPQLPDVLADPIGHFQGRIAQLEALLTKTQEGGQQDSQQIKAHLQEQAMWTAVQASEADIRDPRSASHKADYDEACQHLESARIRQLDRMYPSTSPQVAALARQHGFANPNEYKLHLLNQDRTAVAVHALQTGMSPAQLYYELAVDSGYQAKPNGKGQAEPSLVDRAKAQIEAVKKGTKAAVTLSGGSSRKTADDMSSAELADLFIEDPEMADKIWDKMQKAGKLG